MNTRKKVLVVGEDPDFRRRLRTDAEPGRAGCQFHCVPTAGEALAALVQTPYLAVIADCHLPGGMPGVAFLDEVMRQHPQVLRLIRADLGDQASVMRCIGTPHHCLVQRADVQAVEDALERAIRFEAWLPNERVRHLMSGIRNIPSPPELYFDVVRTLESPTASLEEIGQMIACDPVMTAKVLQLVNSAAFGLQIQVSEPRDAVAYLGITTTKAVILLAHTFSYFSDLVTPLFSIEELWSHSYSTACCAQSIAECESADEGLHSQAFAAGLLHDIGKLMLAANMAGCFQNAIELAARNELELWQAELNVFGADHAEVGGCLLAIWGIPAPIVEAVALHHRPVRLTSGEFTPLVAVHVANVLAPRVNWNPSRPALPQLDMEYLRATGLGERTAEWIRVIAASSALTDLAV